MGRKEAVPVDGTWIKIMRSGTEKHWLLPAPIVRWALDLFLIGRKLNSSATAQEELQTGINSEIFEITAQIVHDSHSPSMVDRVGWLC
jgi:hypothetical protein